MADYLKQPRKFILKDQEADLFSDEYQDTEMTTVHLQYEEGMFDKWLDNVEVEEGSEEKSKEELRSQEEEKILSLIMSLLCLKYRKYLQNFDNRITDIFIALKESETESDNYEADLMFLFKNSHIKDTLCVVIEGIVWYKKDDSTKLDLNKIISLVEPVWFPTLNTTNESFERLKDIYNLYLTEDLSHYELCGQTFNVPVEGVGTRTGDDLLDYIFLREGNMTDDKNPDAPSIYGIFPVNDLLEEDGADDFGWDFDIVFLFKDEIKK